METIRCVCVCARVCVCVCGVVCVSMCVHIRVFRPTFLLLVQCKLELVQLSCTVDHAEAFGRIAFSCPRTEV